MGAWATGCANEPLANGSACPGPDDPCIDTACREGTCVAEPITCDDEDPCTEDACEEGLCVNTPITCDEGDPCTQDLCREGSCSNPPLDCDDGDACTFDACEGPEGCIHASAAGATCPLSPSYWKTHPEVWPVDELVVGGVTRTRSQALSLDPARAQALTLKTALDTYNHDGTRCQCAPPAAPPCDACVGGEKPDVLVLRYQGATCQASDHQQDPARSSCSGDATGTSPAWVVVKDHQTTTFFDGWVEAGETHTAAGSFKGNTCVAIYDAPGGALRQSLGFHTSCSQPLLVGDRFASVTLVGFEGWYGPGDATQCPSAQAQPAAGGGGSSGRGTATSALTFRDPTKRPAGAAESGETAPKSGCSSAHGPEGPLLGLLLGVLARGRRQRVQTGHR